MNDALAELCRSNGIAPSYVGHDGMERRVPERTLAYLAATFGLVEAPSAPLTGISEALAEASPPHCHIPARLRHSRVWGLTCQLPGLASDRNLGVGDFKDLAGLCGLAADAGADFVGLNPLHALFWSDPSRCSPFFPSNRRFLNPIYIAPEWVDGYTGLDAEDRTEASSLRAKPLIDYAGAQSLKERVLTRLYRAYPWSGRSRAAYAEFCAAGGDALNGHAVFEALSEAMVADGHGAGWPGWPEALRDRHGRAVDRFVETQGERISYHLWLQWIADQQLRRVQESAQQAGMRIGLYADFAVGTAPDGSATWTDPELTLPTVSIGAPPDGFTVLGQDWGLAPLSPTRLAELDGNPFADSIAAVLTHPGAVRIDHAMSLARLWLIPRGVPARDGAYVLYPVGQLFSRLAEISNEARALVIGEDLGVVPRGFRELMAARRLHSYKVFFFERDANGFSDPASWPVDSLACIATHDMPTFSGWWADADLELRERLGLLDRETFAAAMETRRADRELLSQMFGSGDTASLSSQLHAHAASGPSRLFALQLEDALGVLEQANVPGTIDEHPNWRRRLPVPLEQIGTDPGFTAHVSALQRSRPR